MSTCWKCPITHSPCPSGSGQAALRAPPQPCLDGPGQDPHEATPEPVHSPHCLCSLQTPLLPADASHSVSAQAAGDQGQVLWASASVL